MTDNFPSYLNNQRENFSIFEEVLQVQLRKIKTSWT